MRLWKSWRVQKSCKCGGIRLLCCESLQFGDGVIVNEVIVNEVIVNKVIENKVIVKEGG